MGEEVNSKVVLLLALIVVLVVTVSTWLLLNKLNSLETSGSIAQPAAVYGAEPQAGSQTGRVVMSILPPGGGESG